MPHDPLSLDDLSRQAAELARRARPLLYRGVIVLDSLSFFGAPLKDRISLSLTPYESEDLRTRILMAFTTVRLGEWIQAKYIAPLVGIDDPNNGHFKATLAEMAKPGGPLLSNKNLGYRLALPPS